MLEIEILLCAHIPLSLPSSPCAEMTKSGYAKHGLTAVGLKLHQKIGT